MLETGIENRPRAASGAIWVSWCAKERREVLLLALLSAGMQVALDVAL